MVFSEEHKDLVEKARLWIQNTATACSVVASLVIQAMFSASLKFANATNKTSFLVFAVAATAGLFSFTTSLLMFMGILTFRCSEDEFLESLHRRLIIGVMALFFSLVTMMVTFSDTIYIVLFDVVGAVSILAIGIAACLPIYLFVKMQFPLIMDMVH
ncbi:hypothetical protein QQ045_009851 [Rhodiola kirilowii]